MAVLESSYKDDLTQEEAKAIAIKAIEAGILSFIFIKTHVKTI